MFWLWQCLPSGSALHRPLGAQGAPKKKKEKSDVPTNLPGLRFFEIFKSDFRKRLCGVFGLLMQRNGQRRYKKKSTGKYGRKKVFFLSTFSAKSF
jgi:hypothetical protein